MDKLKRALITGGSGDIGSAIAKQLAEDGFHVIVHANHNLAKAESIVADLTAQNLSAEAVQFDITQADAVETALNALLELGPIQVIVNNAGIHDDAVMAGMTAEQWQSVIDVSLNGFFNVTQPLLMPMIRTRWGRIINIASIAGVAGNRGQTNYAAAKAGLIGASKSLALELASRKITVNVIAPGIIEGDMTQDVFPPDVIKKAVPMQRAGQPDDIAHAVSYLASDKAGYITRQVLNINGGMI
ncbi:3-oxoacyl-ACP reductase FabG [Hydrogenovibrio thermophilus]|uniref:3-oxoacyl-ACP reductase FabG n=1 Tax=Hydrogenovibrio thermophilus TaxID=265883 RepID=A0A451G405_9GAMM|nr:3-oxoacyl-ACP reductase FabG [Hydrogenovibrio thermophilus]QAB14185.1 3-oxoacyl-ACP reductase FabG [Hydrogenovibrio thermophilus]